MTAPTTPFERTGQFTTLAEEHTFLQQVAEGSAATLSQAGISVGGLPIHRVDIGNPSGSTMLITTLQHANEVAPREGVLQFVRDLAFSSEPDIRDYLKAHRVVVLTPCNPDRIGVDRNNANGVNLNRDHFTLTQPETRAIALTIADVRPALIMDCHGRDDLDQGADWEGQVTSSAAAHSGIRTLGQEMLAHLFGEAEALGWQPRAYDPIRASLDGAAGAHHAVGLLAETWGQQSYPDRAHIMSTMIERARRWHGDNAARLALAAARSRAAARRNMSAYVVQNGDFVRTATETILYPPPSRYVPDSPLPQVHIDAFGITVSPDGSVPMSQPAGWVIPVLMDPASEDRIVAAERIVDSVPGAPPLRLSEAADVRVCIDGAAQDVQSIRVRMHGATTTVWRR